MTYAALTQRPIRLNAYQSKELEESISFDFRQVKDEEEIEDIEEDSTLVLESSTPRDPTTQDPTSKYTKSVSAISYSRYHGPT